MEWVFSVKTPTTFSFGKKKWEKCYNEMCSYYDAKESHLLFLLIPMSHSDSKSKLRLGK